MSGIGDADLVRVRSHDELRAGMTLVEKSDDPWTVIVLRIYADVGLHEDGSSCSTDMAFLDTDTPDHPVCYCDCIGDGTLYRLRDLDDADEALRRCADDVDDGKRWRKRMNEKLSRLRRTR